MTEPPRSSTEPGRRKESDLAILAGKGDKIVDWREQSLRLHREVPSSRFWLLKNWLLKNTGHLLHHLRPGEVIAAADWAVKQRKP